MSLGSWDPSAQAASTEILPESALLARLIDYSRNDQLPQLALLIEDQELQTLSGLMQIDHGVWESAAAELTDEEALHLLRFFAVAENLPGWEAAEKSPVIPLARVLRKRGVKLEREFLQWLRQVNQNRFLPYGPL